MAIQLADYQDILDELGETANEVLEANWQDAARVFSPRGLDTYLKGAAGLSSLGRVTDLVISFIESAPQVAREIGEQAVSELLSAAIQMYSRTSASVLVLLFSTSPTAATRLGELELFRGYIALLNNLLAQAPRALRPMLEKLDTLMGYLTLGGLRRWAMWGVSAYRNDFAAQTAYFSLESDESQAMMKKEQRGVLFVDVQRRLIMYLRALWGQDFFLRPTSGDFESREGYRPYIEHFYIHLPDAFDDFKPDEDASNEAAVEGLSVFRASAAHSAAHIMYS
ncbi:MAG: VWA domain-containing protein, partial [Gammaproteobacteria bacterium]|nr:VWA domain-containing protein [Gammaproteobacteria bacterium]